MRKRIDKLLRERDRQSRLVLEEGVKAKVHVHGDMGTGKTVLWKRFGRDLEAESAKKGSG